MPRKIRALTAAIATAAMTVVACQPVAAQMQTMPFGPGRQPQAFQSPVRTPRPQVPAGFGQQRNQPARSVDVSGGDRQSLATPDGQTREFILRRPNGAGPLPTVIMLHGSGGQAQTAARASGLGELSVRDGFAAVFPEGLANKWNDGRPANAEAISARAGVVPDDVGFLKALVAELVRRGVADPARIYLAGFSNGAFMTYRMACAAPQLFAAIGTFEGDMSEVTGASCRPSVQLPLVAFNATGDAKVHYEGGQGRQGGLWSTDRTLAFFRGLDGCADRSIQSHLPAPEPGATGVTRLQWTECRGAPVTLYRIEGGSHRIPESSFAADALWSFFRDKSRAAAPSPTAARPVGPTHSASLPIPSDQTSVAPVKAAPASAASLSPGQEEVTFESHGSTLYGCITRPAGDGPFPAIIYNHGSEKDPERCGPPALVRAYAEHGYLVFAFQRHGHGQSPGDYIGDLDKQIAASVQDPATRDQQTTLLQDVYNHDVVDAVNWLMQRPEVDRGRVAMTGVSYGGIQTLLAAQKGLGIRAFVAFAPGAMSWKNAALQQRLEQAVRGAEAPIYLAQAQNDYSLGPSEVLGQIIKAKGAPNDAKVYPAFGSRPQQGHAGFAVGGGVAIWSQDVFAFLDRVMAAPTQETDSPEPPAPHAARFGQRRYPPN